MALIGILGALTAFVIIPLKARPAPDKTTRELKLEKEVERLTSALNYWRDAYRAQENETDRLRRERDALVREIERRDSQWTRAQQAQQNGDLRLIPQAAFNQAMAYAQGLQQAQHSAFARPFDGFCNCVPSRAQIIGNDHGLTAADRTKGEL